MHSEFFVTITFSLLVMKRLLYSVLLFFSIMVLPWYVYASLIIAGMFLFNNFYEGIVWVIIIEILYGPPGIDIFQHTFMLWMVAATIVALVIKRSVRYYD